jgi:hypothetical protein
MTELEVLDRDISGLKELIRVAWSDLANPLLTPFGRREAREQIKRCSAELRNHLQMIESQRQRAREQTLEKVKRNSAFSETTRRLGDSSECGSKGPTSWLI